MAGIFISYKRKEWNAVIENNPSEFKGDRHPVDTVSWNNVQTFIERLNEKEDCRGCYRLPSEAEWEYAARAGTMGEYSFGDDASRLDQYSWYGANSGDQTHPVGEKRPNLWGLFDMHGNVYEWVQDWYEKYPSSSVTDPIGPESGSHRVLRGGGWNYGARDVRLAFRNHTLPEGRDSDYGFRLVRNIPL